jgi:2',3'-cyclic-nucleotide 2'-phosphodiesterase (5'-nucleotidase family)
LLWVLIFVFALVLHGADPSHQEIIILAGGDAQGVLEPCGCSSGQLGGISRRDTLIDALSKQNPARTLLLDKGGFIREPGLQSTIKAEFLIRAYSQIGTRILGLAPGDLFQGASRVLAMSKDQQVEILCSNIQVAGRQNNFRKFTTRTLGKEPQNLTVGLTAVIGKNAIPELGVQDSLSIEDPVLALRPVIEKLKPRVNILITLVHDGEDEARRIAREIPQIDLIFFGHDADSPTFRPIREGSTRLISSGTMGRHLAVTRIKFDANKKIEGITLDLKPLDAKLNKSTRMESLLQEYQDRLSDLQLLERRSPPPHPNGSYSGSQACQSCHQSAFSAWKKSAHSHAYQILTRENHARDPECAPCHSTGFHYAGGFLSPEKTPHLLHVGCESCHGPGQSHVDSPRLYPMKPVAERTCRTCHNSTQTPHFQFKAFFERIKH